MAFKLTKGELADRDTHVEKLRELVGTIEDAINTVNEGMSEFLRPVHEAIAAYNEYLTNTVSEFTTTISDRLTEEMSGKSEKWQESEKGTSTEAFIGEWESVVLDEVAELDDVEISVEVPDNADTVEALPSEAEG